MRVVNDLASARESASIARERTYLDISGGDARHLELVDGHEGLRELLKLFLDAEGKKNASERGNAEPRAHVESRLTRRGAARTGSEETRDHGEWGRRALRIAALARRTHFLLDLLLGGCLLQRLGEELLGLRRGGCCERGI